jgi:hypothetical protein
VRRGREDDADVAKRDESGLWSRHCYVGWRVSDVVDVCSAYQSWHAWLSLETDSLALRDVPAARELLRPLTRAVRFEALPPPHRPPINARDKREALQRVAGTHAAVLGFSERQAGWLVRPARAYRGCRCLWCDSGAMQEPLLLLGAAADAAVQLQLYRRAHGIDTSADDQLEAIVQHDRTLHELADGSRPERFVELLLGAARTQGWAVDPIELAADETRRITYRVGADDALMLLLCGRHGTSVGDLNIATWLEDGQGRRQPMRATTNARLQVFDVRVTARLRVELSNMAGESQTAFLSVRGGHE